MTGPQKNVLRIGDGRDWHFVNGDWVDDTDGQLSVPADLIRSDGYAMQGHHYAFHRRSAYGNVKMQFEFMLKGHSDVGVVLRAADESHFYLLHFPCCGQARRAQHFWAAFSRMDDSGHLRCVKLEMLRRVPSNIGYWVPVELSLMGGRLTVSIGEHGYFEAQDSTYAGPGHVGLYVNSYYDSGFGIRNVVVDGVPGVDAFSGEVAENVLAGRVAADSTEERRSEAQPGARDQRRADRTAALLRVAE